MHNYQRVVNVIATEAPRINIMVLELAAMSLQKHDTISVSLTTYPINQMVDVDVWDHSTGSPELKEQKSIRFNDPDAETEIDRLINKVRGLYGEQAS
ncbi:hypothetical protein [Pseudoalteromonas sp. R3]|uniref:hypothetical protein n=1 Tax=Pseudoalteromonas sp. R3 TaxID=1709477 RepID=UPI0006B4C80D|nr:hypothetical protein [Pseudoalteromonas sp. R3]AZZ98786.1 hypothetical protein ELR70_17770 [Pseudoalteromonas sp. R3]